MNSTRNVIFILSLTLCVYYTSAKKILQSQSNAEDDGIKEQIDEFVEELLDCFDVHGASLTVVKDGEPFIVKGYGVTDRGGETPVTNQTRFCIASASKAMIGALFASLFSDDDIDANFSTPIREILGDWFYFSEGYRSAKVTTRDLLAHRTGMSSTEDLRLAGIDQEELPRRIRFFPMGREFRERPEIYNNIIYGLSTYVASTLAGKPWEEALRERLLDPLGMTSSVPMHLSEPYWSEFATAYRNYEGEPRQMSIEIPTRTYNNVPGMGSTAEDMAKWLMFQLSGGQTPDGDQLVDPEQFEETHRPCSYQSYFSSKSLPDDPVMSFVGNYAIGWNEGYYRGYKVSRHGGSQGGYQSLVSLLPALGIGVYSTMPRYEATGANEPLHDYVMDLLTGEDPWFDASDICPNKESNTCSNIEDAMSMLSEEQKEYINGILSLEKDHVESDVIRRPMSEFVGVYGHYGYGNMTVTLEDEETLRLSYGPRARWHLEKIGESDVFVANGLEPFWYWSMVMEFGRDDEGNVDRIAKIENFAIINFMRNLDWNDIPPPPDVCD